jgi:transcriptional regulator with XRE-family HTH domain
MSQDQLGKQLGVTGTSIANWEARRTTPSAKYVSQLLELENLPPKPKPAPAPYPIPDPAETRAQLAEYRAKKAAEETIEPPATVAGTVPVFDADARRLAEAQNLTDDDPEPAILPDFPSNLTVDTVEADPEDSGRIADMEHDINAAVAFAKHLESRLRVVEREQEPARVLYPPITTNLDAFRLLVRTFGIDTADQVVDLLRG